ncbi:MAG TPA: hypothetical protein VNV41_16400 [Candidatus Acidoferrales bacterium]|jgi:hypothetical protein|nr:hypothetical protein [Candidatus Acidoferrales bacterium]
MKRILALIMLFAGVASAQQISPTAEEFKGPRAKGFFTVSNAGTTPLLVTVEAKNLAVAADGHPSLTADLPNVTVSFKNPQFKLGPRAVYMVNFDATCTTVPCHFELLATFAPLVRHEGLTVEYHLGTAIYVCSKQKDCRKNTLARLAYPVQN